jgi:hypothetical protein
MAHDDLTLLLFGVVSTSNWVIPAVIPHPSRVTRGRLVLATANFLAKLRTLLVSD